MGHREYVDPLLNEVTYAFQLFATFSAYVFNIILIFIVQRTSNKEIGTYRILITYFALSDMYYNTVHFIVYPIPENYGNAFIMGAHGYYRELLGVGLYMGAYGHTFPILIFHFLYRLLAIKYPQYLAYFPAFIFALIVCTAAYNGIWFSIFYGLFHPDDVTVRILAPVFNGSIPLPIVHSMETAAKHSQALYWTDGTFESPRWNNLLGAAVMSSSMLFTYTIIVCCSYRINKYIEKRSKSSHSIHLHKQLFRSLIYQSFVPLFTAYYPAGSAVLLPIFGLPFIPTSIVVPVACVTHPLFDPLLLIFTINGYRRAFLNLTGLSKLARKLIRIAPKELTMGEFTRSTAPVSTPDINSDAAFADLMDAAGSTPVVVEFVGDCCGPCKVIAPLFDQLSANNPALHFFKVDIDQATSEVTYSFQVFATALAYVFNIILIFIVQRHSNKEIGTYRILITYFALSDMYYNTLHFIVYPIPENYGNAFFVGGHGYYPELLGVGLYMGAYGHAFPILIFHFLYRLFARDQISPISRVFPFFPIRSDCRNCSVQWNLVEFSVFYSFFHPDDVSLGFLAPVFNGSIAHPIAHRIETAAKHSQALYWNQMKRRLISFLKYFLLLKTTHGTFEGPRWRNILGALLMSSSMIFTYSIIVCCSYRISKERSKSPQSIHLHKQLFRSLIYQSFVPLFTAYYPAGSAVLLPAFGLPFTPTSILCPVACVTHPVFDPLLLIFTINDYRRAFLDLIGLSRLQRALIRKSLKEQTMG
ncbi:str-101 [Pristionchus pacificus]|uniref:Serpentine receptor class r-10 n=1 Tax=Pristionchus pacificus TaxID=54126 RepID=A0A2A6CLW0_PRIPA|nr:str-101 [Pristionchus pacificus]|eukprot:PDM79194.1 str-101 protein [Pristionchus pacificus]